MKMRTKICSVFLLTVLLILFGMMSVGAEEAQEVQEVQENAVLTVGKVTAEPGTGETVEVPLTIAGNTGISGALITVSYDEELVLDEVSGGEAFASMQFTKPANMTKKSVRMLWAGSEDVKADGVIASLVFEAPQEIGTYEVSVSCNSEDVLNADLEPVEIRTESGSVEVREEDTSTVFSDVKTTDYFCKPVLWAVERGITKGYADGTFGPKLNCSRGDMMMFLWRLAGKPMPVTKQNPFIDVSTRDYYYYAVLWASENGITKGYADNTFRPKETCLREHAVMFLWRLAGKPAPRIKSNPFTDVSPSDYYYQAVLWASENKIARGYNQEDGTQTYGPQLECLREHIVTFLYRFDAYGFKPAEMSKGELLVAALQEEATEVVTEAQLPEDGLIEEDGSGSETLEEVLMEDAEEMLGQAESVAISNDGASEVELEEITE